MMTTELEKPDRASARLKMSVSISTINTPIATKSDRAFPDMNNTDATAKTDNVMIIGPFIP